MPGCRGSPLATGGGYFELTSANNLGPTFTRIADELHRQYSLGVHAGRRSTARRTGSRSRFDAPG